VADLERRKSECKQADEILQILTELVDIAPVSITVHDLDGCLLYANQKTFDLMAIPEMNFLLPRSMIWRIEK
jgi:hypothetical protein